MFIVRFAVLSLCCVLNGCCWFAPKAPRPSTTQFYNGATDPMARVIADINQNNAKIPTLWAELNYTADLVDPEKNSVESVAGDGRVMYARPRSLLLNGDKDIAGQVFQLGSNDEEFWVKIRADANTYRYWWGHYANLGKPGCKAIPIRPDLVLQVLGIGVYGPDFLQQPVPVMRFDNEHDAYIFDLNVRSTDQWQTVEEIWYTREKKLPTHVVLYAKDGRAQLIADLSGYIPVESAGIPRDRWPLMAGHYALYFPENKDRITFDFISPIQLQHVPPRGAPIPNANTFERIEPDAGDKVMQIDADVVPGGATMAQ
jgi:hypothetical protein